MTTITAKYSVRKDKRFPGNQPFQLTGTPNKTKKHSNMVLFKQTTRKS